MTRPKEKKATYLINQFFSFGNSLQCCCCFKCQNIIVLLLIFASLKWNIWCIELHLATVCPSGHLLKRNFFSFFKSLPRQLSSKSQSILSETRMVLKKLKTFLLAGSLFISDTCWYKIEHFNLLKLLFRK